MSQRAPSPVTDVATSMEVRVDFLEHRDALPALAAERFQIEVGQTLFAGVHPPTDTHYVRRFERFFDHLRAAEFPGNFFRLELLPYAAQLFAKEDPRQASPFRIHVDGERRTAGAAGWTVFAEWVPAVQTRFVIDVEARQTGRVVRFTGSVLLGAGERRKTDPAPRAVAELVRERWALKRIQDGTNEMRVLCETLAWIEQRGTRSLDAADLEDHLKDERAHNKRWLDDSIVRLVRTLYVWINGTHGPVQTLRRFPVSQTEWNAALRVLDLAQICVAPECGPVSPMTDQERFYSGLHEVSTLLKIAEEIKRHRIVTPTEVTELLSRSLRP